MESVEWSSSMSSDSPKEEGEDKDSPREQDPFKK